MGILLGRTKSTEHPSMWVLSRILTNVPLSFVSQLICGMCKAYWGSCKEYIQGLYRPLRFCHLLQRFLEQLEGQSLLSSSKIQTLYRPQYLPM